MDRESIIALQKVDCNCNDCVFMERDIVKKGVWDSEEWHLDQKNASHRIHYGRCVKKDKEVSFIPNTCQLDTQECFKHRRDK